jgi:hypothetical protein
VQKTLSSWRCGAPNFVFAHFGTNRYKDKDAESEFMEPSESPAGSHPFPTQPRVIFAHWREALNAHSLSGPARAGYALAISGYLDYCRRNGLSVSLESARAFMADAERRRLAHNPKLWKEGLNWFFKEGQRTSGPTLPGVPSVGCADTGETPWERRLIERLRLNHYSWRTEQTVSGHTAIGCASSMTRTGQGPWPGFGSRKLWSASTQRRAWPGNGIGSSRRDR